MKSQKLFFVSMLLFAYFPICFGQEKPEAILVDEFPAVSCDDFLSRAEHFFIELQNNPESQGYAVIFGSNGDLRRKIGYELLIKGTIALRNFDKNRIILVRGEEVKNFQVQFWRVSSGAEKPDLKETKWNFVFLPQAKPFKFYDDMADGICPPTPFETVYAEYLNANPQARGRIVIYAKTLKKYNKLKKEARDLLKDIPINRLSFFHVKRKRSVNYANVEYWLVPRKKR